jgi:hypothetical protein
MPTAASTVGMMSIALASASLIRGMIVPGWRNMIGVRRPPSYGDSFDRGANRGESGL